MEQRPKQPTGAAPEHFMTHLSITEGAPRWGAHVTDAEYQASRPR